jgi:hypothetical protein
MYLKYFWRQVNKKKKEKLTYCGGLGILLDRPVVFFLFSARWAEPAARLFLGLVLVGRPVKLSRPSPAQSRSSRSFPLHEPLTGGVAMSASSPSCRNRVELRPKNTAAFPP